MGHITFKWISVGEQQKVDPVPDGERERDKRRSTGVLKRTEALRCRTEALSTVEGGGEVASMEVRREGKRVI